MKYCYLDNSATSFPKSPKLGEAVSYYINNLGVNVNRSSYVSAQKCEDILMETREALCRFFNFNVPSHVIFTSSITSSINTILKGFLSFGDEIIVSPFEHNAVMRPLYQLKDKNICIKTIPMSKTGEIDFTSLEKLVTPKVKLVVCTHASNVFGNVLQVKLLGDFCKKHNLYFVLDSAQTAGHYRIDFRSLNLSALCFTAHKGLLSPEGLGGMLLSRDFAQQIAPLITGGTGSFSDSFIQPTSLPDKFEAGTINLPAIYGLNHSLKFINSLGVDKIHIHEKNLINYFKDGISNLENVTEVGSFKENIGTISLNFNCDNSEVAFKLDDEYNIMTRCGLHCSPLAHKFMGTYPQGTVRFSVGYSTSIDDIDYTLNSIKTICENI